MRVFVALFLLCCLTLAGQDLYQIAEFAMRCKNYVKARDAYKVVLQSNVPLDPLIMADITTRLALAEKELGQLSEAESRLQLLLKKQLCDDSYLNAMLLLAKIEQQQNKQEEAFRTLKTLQKRCPFEQWPPEDRGFFIGCQQLVKERYYLQLARAKKLYNMSLFQESASLFEQLWKKMQEGRFPQEEEEDLLYFLANAYLQVGKNQEVIALLRPRVAVLSQKLLYLLAMAYKNVGKIEDSKGVLSSLSSAEAKVAEASLQSSAIPAKEGLASCPTPLAKLHLAKLYLQERDAPAAEGLLQQVLQEAKGMQKYDALALLAESCMQQREYEKAIRYFDQTLPRQELLYRKGQAFLKLAATRPEYQSKAERFFKEFEPEEEVWEEKKQLALAELMLMKNDPAMIAFLDQFKAATVEGEAESFLLRARSVQPHYFKMLTESMPYSQTICGKRGWYFRGSYVLALAKERGSAALQEKAVQFFDRGYLELKGVDQELAALCLLLAAEHAPLLDAFPRLAALLASENFSSFSKKEEALYLHVRKATQAALQEGSQTFLEEAYNSSCRLTGSLAPMGRFLFASTCLQMGLYERAHILFCDLANEHPLVAAKSLYYAAEAAEKLGLPDVARGHREKIINCYCAASVAAESYLRIYCFADYVQGDAEPLAHLQAMPELFAESPFLIYTHYLLGLQAHSLEHLLAAIDLYAQKKPCIAEEQSKDFQEVYRQAKMEFASLSLEMRQQEEKAMQLLQENIEEFGSEESERLLGLLLAATGQEESALQLYAAIEQRYRDKGITSAYYLALAQFESALILEKKEQLPQALLFCKACENSLELIGGEQKLQVWMLTSKIARRMGDLPQAMLYLSYVINDTVSSSLRIEAMLQRAELYSLQGRHELAIRQLEAVCSKGGDLALIAKAKLKEDYGL